MSFDKPEVRKLLAPGRIGTLELKNRIAMPAMATRYGGIWGEVSNSLIQYQRRRAIGGCGLIMTECTLAATAIDGLRLQTRELRADDVCYIPGFACLAEAIHENGAKAGVQLSPGSGAQAKAGPWIPGFQYVQDIQPVSPSGVPGFGRKDRPRILSVEEIEKIIQLCGHSAWNVKQAGFDVVEVHALGGYLITQFLSPYFNKRADKYGGSLENRCRFLMEIVHSIRNCLGVGFPLTVKYSIEDHLPGGWDIPQSQDLAQRLEDAGVDAIAVSSGAHGSKAPGAPHYFYPRNTFIRYAEAIKKVVKIPVIAGGRLDDPKMAEKVLEEGKADFIYVGRALIADPDWPNKVASGHLDEIRPCLACNECQHSVHSMRIMRCSVNAVAGREGEYDEIRPATAKKRVMIVGGGPAGMEAARVSALEGHEVILCDSNRQLGGKMLLGGIHNEEITAFRKWLVEQVKKLPIEVRLQTEVTTALVEEIKPDVVILATGGTFVTPKVPGIDRDNVFSAQDLLKLMNGIKVDKGVLMSSLLPFASRAITASTVNSFLSSPFPIKKKVAIIGGQFPGCSLAILLAHKGKQVTMIEESDQFGKDMEAHIMVVLQGEIDAGNVKVLTSAKTEEITEKGIVVSDTRGNRTLVEADTVMVALDLAPTTSNLEQELRVKVRQVYTIGDAKSFRRITKAVSEGYVTAYKL